jgi:hypothetical protein
MARKIVVLNADEIAELDRQNPASAKDGGFQAFIVRLQGHVRRGTQEIILSDDDQENIARYAFDYQQGGWQDRLVTIFGRTLGAELGRERS